MSGEFSVNPEDLRKACAALRDAAALRVDVTEELAAAKAVLLPDAAGALEAVLHKAQQSQRDIQAIVRALIAGLIAAADAYEVTDRTVHANLVGSR